MDYCAAANQIKSYASSTASNTVFAKNIDCVSLDADLVACDALTISGVAITGITDVTDKTQNINSSTTANRTLHTGAFVSADLETTRITAIDSTGLSLQSSVEQSISNSTGGITLYLTNPNLGTSSTNYMGLQIGTSKTVSNAAWQMLYYNTSLTGSTSNRLDFKMAGQFTPTLSLINGKVGIYNSVPTEALDVKGNGILSGTLAVTGASTLTGLVTAAGNITMSGTSATANLKATTVTSLTNTGNATVTGTLGVTGVTTLSSLTNTGNATVGGTLGVTGVTTLSSLTNTGNATVGGNLTVTGAISGTITNTLYGTSIGTGGGTGQNQVEYSIANTPYEVWFSFRELYCSGFSTLSGTIDQYYLKFITNGGTAVIFDFGYTQGTNANGSRMWGGGVMPLWNTQLNTTGPTVKLCGNIRLSRITSSASATAYMVTGEATRQDLAATTTTDVGGTGYVTTYIGIMRLVGSETLTALRVSCNAGIGGAARDGVSVSANLSYAR